ncbi:PAS domain S-box-containing protein [Marivirga sericea]|uniref:PAS domain S-box-containing protein n=1 Tax=Marivirga sericea TaxID=1028 RepID=A0A1X7KEF0_9BACT|nr:PAS domain S-box protein [Marivirga sericea]SMG39321.1 PAS domain S-box-containing protein [Marivirga sericea]
MQIDRTHKFLIVGLSGILVMLISSILLTLVLQNLNPYYHLTIYAAAFVFFFVMMISYKRERSAIKQISDLGTDLSVSDTVFEIKSSNTWTRNFYQDILTNRQKIKQATEWINTIAEGGKLELAAENDDELSKAVVNLQSELIKFRSKEEKRTWQAEGLAKFSELLRSYNENIKDFGFHIISETVKYINGNQGALFLAGQDEDEEYLDMIGCYAYERRKLARKRISKGEGLVGQCMQEKDLIYITDVPEQYVKITSGLGHALPRHIIIIPLISDEKMVGAMELASFQILEDYQIDFLKDLAKNIAASVAVIQVNENTQLLLEKSQKMSSELQANEEEMRQNMEEMEATQEEMARNQMELDGVFSAINNTLLKAEFDIEGNVIATNQKFIDFLKWEETEIKNKRHSHICKNADLCNEVWSRVQTGNNHIVEFETRTSKKEKVWIEASYSPVLDAAGNLSKVLLLGQDISERIANEEEQRRLSLVADNTDNSVIITDKDGLIEYVNSGFENMTGYTLNEIVGKKPGEFLQGPETNQETKWKISQLLKEQKPIYEEILNYSKDGRTYWVSLAINPVRDENGELKNYIAVQADITATKKSALDAKYKLEAIGRSNAVIEFDTNGFVLDANQNYLDIVGFEKDELIGKHHEVMVDQYMAKSTEYKNLWSRLAQGEFITGEFERYTKSGKKVILKGVFNPIFDINGNAIKVVKFATDITQEKRLELENQRQQVELMNHMEAINKTIGSLEFDKKGKIVTANEIYLSITGFKMEDIQGKSYFDLLPEKDRFKPQYQLMWESLQNGKFFSGEFKQVDKQGHEVWLSGTINPIYDNANNLEKVLLLAQFTTKEKQKLNDLGGSVTAMKGVIPILELNTDFSLKNANPLFFEASGYSRMSLKSVDFSDSFKLEKGFSSKSILKELQNGKRVETTLKFQTQQGDWVESNVSIAAVQNLDLELDKIIILFTGMVEQQLKLKNVN